MGKDRAEGEELNRVAMPIAALLTKAEQDANAVSKLARGYAQGLKRAARELESGKSAVVVVDGLARKLEQMAPIPAVPPPAELVKQLATAVEMTRKTLKASAAASIHAAAREAGLTIKLLTEGFGIGPFKVAIDHASMTASIEYARVVLEPSLPLEARRIVESVEEHQRRVFDCLLDPDELLPQFEEAMRVVWVRKNRTLPRELRDDLPGLYREMKLARLAAAPRRGGGLDYTLARFVVELKTLLQSPRNLESSPSLRPETAVIENTKNARKSVFIPKNLECGYGEGTYYQAVVQK